jgi:hypothetical protein
MPNDFLNIPILFKWPSATRYLPSTCALRSPKSTISSTNKALTRSSIPKTN